MSIDWPTVTLDPQALSHLPSTRTPSPALRRACKRYVIAMHNLNKQLVALNMDVLLRQLQTASSHEEVRAVMTQCELVPFASVPVNTLSSTMPTLITLHRAFQCLHVLKDTLDSWDNWAADTSSATNGQPASTPSFSFFAPA